MKPLKHDLVTFANSFNLEFIRFFLGVSDYAFFSCHPHARLLYSLGNGGETTLDDGKNKISFDRGMWLFIPPFVKVKHLHRQSRHISIHFNYSLLRGTELSAGIKHICAADAPELLPMAEAMSDAPDRRVHFAAAAGLLVHTALQHIIRLPEFDCGKYTSGLIKYSKLTEKLYREPNPNITVAAMAKIMNLSEQNFARKFPADTGITPRKLNEQIIMQQAVKLLLNSELTIKEIAEKLNFSNEYYFSRCFKRCMALPPGKFRQEMQE